MVKLLPFKQGRVIYNTGSIPVGGTKMGVWCNCATCRLPNPKIESSNLSTPAMQHIGKIILLEEFNFFIYTNKKLMKILEKFTRQEIINLLETTKSFRDFLIKIGSSFNGSASYVSIKKQLDKLQIVVPNYKKLTNERFDRKSNEEIFVENSSYSRYWLKKRILKDRIIDYKCSKCENNGKWLNTELTLQLEHKNGINNDNRIENLEFLCPNCHSQTTTYAGKKHKKEKEVKTIKETKPRKEKYCECGKKIHRTSQRCSECAMKNIRKINRPSYIQLISDIEDLGYCGAGRKYNVSDNTIRKWIKKMESE